jgi:Rha family phage regulatory protein
MTIDLVHLHDQHATTTSLIVAEKFGKRHDTVLRAIRNLECSPEFHRRNFAELIAHAEVGKGAQKPIPAYSITRDGFAFLAMGFTGKEAAAWKEKFIAAFNALEAQVLKQLEQQAKWEADHIEQAKAHWFKKCKHWQPIYELLIVYSLEPKRIAERIGKSVASVRRAIHRMIEVGILHPRLVREVIKQSAFARELTRSGVFDRWGKKARQLDLFALEA